MTRNEFHADLQDALTMTKNDFEKAAQNLAQCYGMPNFAEGWTGWDMQADVSDKNLEIPLDKMTADQADHVVFLINEMLDSMKVVKRQAEYWAVAKREWENRMEYECDDD